MAKPRSLVKRAVHNEAAARQAALHPPSKQAPSPRQLTVPRPHNLPGQLSIQEPYNLSGYITAQGPQHFPGHFNGQEPPNLSGEFHYQGEAPNFHGQMTFQASPPFPRQFHVQAPLHFPPSGYGNIPSSYIYPYPSPPHRPAVLPDGRVRYDPAPPAASLLRQHQQSRVASEPRGSRQVVVPALVQSRVVVDEDVARDFREVEAMGKSAPVEERDAGEILGDEILGQGDRW